MALTPSEALVARVCRRSFLSLWSEANPLARPGKELCDLLVVCDPDVVIFSVKEVALGKSGQTTVDWERWRRRAVDDSAKQIYGAERWIRRNRITTRADGSAGLPLPNPDALRIHRVAVALGSEGEVPFEQGGLDRGFVHVLDELALERVLGELDTVRDFVEYLAAKEALVASGRGPILLTGEHDLLAVYLQQGRRFPPGEDGLLIEPGAWETLTAKSEWRRRKDADAESYVWDGLIETLTELTGGPGSVGAQELPEREAVLRDMARENRFARRILAAAFNEFMRDAAALKTRARVVRSPSGTVYVFLAAARDEDRTGRVQELTMRCVVARGLAEQAGIVFATDRETGENGAGPPVVVGLATERYAAGQGFSLDAVRVSIPVWTADHQRTFEGIQRDLGYFAAPRYTQARADEYPPPPATTSRTKDSSGNLRARPGRNTPCPCGSGRKYKRCCGASR